MGCPSTGRHNYHKVAALPSLHAEYVDLRHRRGTSCYDTTDVTHVRVCGVEGHQLRRRASDIGDAANNCSASGVRERTHILCEFVSASLVRGVKLALVVELVGLGDLEFDKSRKDSTIEIGSQG